MGHEMKNLPLLIGIFNKDFFNQWTAKFNKISEDEGYKYGTNAKNRA